MKFETTKQNRPKTPSGLTTAIEKALADKQIVIRKIARNNKGWGIAYQYASNSTLPAIKRLFKDVAIFAYYESIEDCLKGEYDRIVLGIDDGNGTLNDAVVEKMQRNRVLDFQAIDLHRMLELGNGKVKLEDVRIGKNFQFPGDRNGVRHVLDVDGEYVLLQTLGHSTESGNFYVVHYTQLWPNTSPVWDDNNKIREYGTK